MRKKLLLLSIISITISNLLSAQSTDLTGLLQSMRGSNSWKYSPELSEEELYMYDRLLYMSKEDWELFRSDPRYDDQRVRAIYTENKGKLSNFTKRKGGSQGSAKSLTDDCECWIEPDASYTASDPNDWPNCGGGGPGVDCWIGPLQLPFNFCFFGQDFNQIVLTSKGTIVFGNTGYFDWTPSEFPTPANGEPQYDHICGFWADFDFRASGELYYKITQEAFYLNYVEVGYFANHADKTNTFQIIITANDAGVVPGSNNVQFCYKDMQWAHGDVGGTGGFSGPTPANVGADRLAGNNGVQFGRFNLNNGNYNGPNGANANQQDGINWLDFRTLNFNTCVTSPNNAPLATVSAPCDTISLCQGEIYDLTMQFLAPEAGQNTVITTTQTGTGLTSTVTAGNTATHTGSFAANGSNAGINVVTITATDNGNPAQSTTLTYVFEVFDIVPPAISIEGVLTFCAGGETILSATPGFDSYSWSTGCDTQDCAVDDGGDVTVVGTIGECSSTATAFVDATEYFIPSFTGGNVPIELCPGVSQDVCLEEEWVTYEWFVYPGYEGNIPSSTPTNEQCFQASGSNPGYYGVIVQNEAGCEGLNIQQIVQVQSFIDPTNDDLSGAYCDGLETIEFTGGYSNPASGTLLVYCQDQSSSGWQGAYLTTVVTHPDGTSDSYIMSTTGTFTFFNVPIGLGDTFTLTYTNNGNATLDVNNYFWVINCNGEVFQSPVGMTPGLVYSGTSSCAAQPLSGTWTVTGPAGWSLTTTNVYNPVASGVESPNIFTPGDYGIYELCFNDPTCSLDYCYTLEFTETPTLTLSPDGNTLLCDAETVTGTAAITDLGGTGEITWTGNSINVANNQLSAVAGPYVGYVNYTVTASITNGCGTASDSFTVQHQNDVPAVVLTDQLLCAGASITLDPVTSSFDNSNLVYTWTPGTLSGPAPTVSAAGVYCVTVSNLCDSEPQACANIVAVPTATAPALPPSILECDDDQVTLTTNVPLGYSITWSNGQSNVNSITVDASGEYCYDITDLAGCNTSLESCSNIVISQIPTTAADVTDERPVCPGECEVLNLESTNATSYTWSSSCTNLPIPSNLQATFELCSETVPLECQLLPFTVTGTASNVCGSSSTTFVIAANVCNLKIPNVFTPNGDQFNSTFFIEGLDFYPRTKIQIFDRWGKEIYSSMNYQNDWGPRDLSTGTYYYIIELPFGTTTLVEGHFTVLK